jgi:hypothetical protein
MVIGVPGGLGVLFGHAVAVLNAYAVYVMRVEGVMREGIAILAYERYAEVLDRAQRKTDLWRRLDLTRPRPAGLIKPKRLAWSSIWPLAESTEVVEWPPSMPDTLKWPCSL